MNPTNTIEKLYTDALMGLNKPLQTEAVCVYILELFDATSPDKTKSTEEIWSKYQELKTDDAKVVELVQNSTANYLSQLSKSPTSRISCPGRKKGYYVIPVDVFNADVEAADQESNPTDTQIKLKEKDLYSCVRDWLLISGCQSAADISSARAMEKWNNPDLLGIKVIDFFGDFKIELTTVEVKPDITNWKMFIFEAVAHTMFANRSYFAYRCKESDIVKTNDMIEYAEKFRIGILAIIVPDDKWDRPFDDEGYPYIQVVAPAPYNRASFSKQQVFLSGLGIKDRNALSRYGM